MRTPTQLSYEQFIMKVSDIHGQIREKDPYVRYGQSLFNTLAHHRPEIAEQLRGTHLDPFHKTGEKISLETYEFIKNLW